MAWAIGHHQVAAASGGCGPPAREVEGEGLESGQPRRKMRMHEEGRKWARVVCPGRVTAMTG